MAFQICGFRTGDYLPYLDDIIVHPFGSDICLWHLDQKNKRDYIRTMKNGISSFCVNNVKQLVAVAEYGINPEILLHRFPLPKDKKEPQRIKTDAKIQITKMEFSRDGHRLVAISGLPDYKISVYDTERGEKLPGISENLPDKKILKVAFNPSDHNVFALMTESTVFVYTIEQTCEFVSGGFKKSYKLGCKTTSVPLECTDMFWDKTPHLVVADKKGKRVVVLEIKEEDIIEKESKQFEEEPLAMLLTQTQIIISFNDGNLHWFSYDDKDQQIIGETPLHEAQIEYGPLQYMIYNNPMTKIIGTTSKGVTVMVQYEAPCEEDEEMQPDLQDKEGGKKDKGKDNFKLLPAKLGDFLTAKIICIKELPDSTQVMTISSDGAVCLWENTAMQQLAKLEINSTPICAEIDPKGEVAYIGCSDGCLRIVDLSDRMILRLVKIIKLYTSEITKIKLGPDGLTLACSSQNNKGVFFINSLAESGFLVQAYYTMPENIISLDWLKTDPGTPAKIIAILKNSLMMIFSPPPDTAKNLVVDYDKHPCSFNVIDNNMAHILCTPSGDILVTGNDRKIKKYDVPDTTLSDIDMRKPASAPTGEFPGHGLGISCWAVSADGKLLASGSKDGTYQIRMLTSLGQAKEGKSHSMHQGGVSAMSFSPARNMLYIAGGDGSFLMLNMSKEPLPSAPRTPTDIGEVLRGIEEVEDPVNVSLPLITDLWKDEEKKQKEEEKEKLKDHIREELQKIKEGLRELLNKNEQMEDIEKLDREEFLIDKVRKERMLKEKDMECEKLRKQAAKENLRAEILRNRIKECTWDQMEIQSTGCKSLNSDQMMYNYPVRNQTSDELTLYNKLANIRRLEIKESIERRAEELLIDKADLSLEREHYLVNRFPNKPTIQEEVQEKIMTSSITNTIDFNSSPSKIANQGAGSPEKEKLKYKYRRPGLLARGGQKFTSDMDDQYGKEKKEEQQKDDIRLAIKQEKKEIEYYRKNWKTLEGYELLYEPFELQSNSRKRMQIIFIKDIIRRMKKDFNKEFEDLCNFKSEQISLIKEKNSKIEELQKDLKEESTKFEISFDPREKPEHILTVTEEDIKIPKYLTKEEKIQQEEQRRKEEERLKALQSDTLGRRGIMSMMGGVLEMKRELDELEKSLVRQPWMDLPENQMTEAQRQEYTKFRQMEEDLKERKLNQQKAWKQELNKAHTEIEELCSKFEERMNKLMKKKLFMQLRVYEQELYIIRLNLSLFEEKLLREEKTRTENDIQMIEAEKEKLKEILNQLNSDEQKEEEDLDVSERQRTHDPNRKTRKDEELIKDEGKKALYSIPGLDPQSLEDFIKRGREKIREIQEKNAKGSGKDRKEDNGMVFRRSPYVQTDRKIVDEQENYNYRLDCVFPQLNEDNFKILVTYRKHYVDSMKTQYEKESEKEVQKKYEESLSKKNENLDETLVKYNEELRNINNNILQNEENIELIIRIKQGQVEISLIEIAPKLDTAILINREVIQSYNQKIIKNANTLLDQLMLISKYEKERRENEWKSQRKEKSIEYLKACTLTVKQERIGRHPVFKKKDEIPMLENEKIKTLDMQITKLQKNANSRIKTINSKIMALQKQIEDKKKENDDLEQKARKMQDSVKQRIEILDLSSGGGGEEVKQETQNKMKIIATKRRLNDLLVQQEEEFMMLSEELNRIREKTFPSFANVQTKYEYPDEKAP